MNKKKARSGILGISALLFLTVLLAGGTYGWLKQEAEVNNELASHTTEVTIEEKETEFQVESNTTQDKHAALKNSGFAPFYRQTKVCVSVTDEAGAVCYTDEWEEELLKLSGGNEDDRELALTGTIPTRGWESGTYRVYINLSDADSGEQILLANEADATENGYCLGEVAVR